MPEAACGRKKLFYRFLCIRCGNVVTAKDAESLAEKMKNHYTDTWRPANSGCKRVENRYKSMVICGFDHGLDDALWACQRRLDSVQRDAKEKQRAATKDLRVEADELRALARRAHDRAEELDVANRSLQRRLEAAETRADAISVTDDTLAAIAASSSARKRKLTAFLHPDGLGTQELSVRAKEMRDALGL